MSLDVREEFFFDHPQHAQRVRVGERVLPNPRERWFGDHPRIGMVISTYAATPFVELALAVRRRYYPDLPVLIHDDASPQRDALIGLCDTYGATFQCNSARLEHEMGDLSVIVGGLHWARANGIELLVKISRRCVPTNDWVAALSRMAGLTQFGTYGRECHSNQLPLRTEFFAMAVEPWSQPAILEEMTGFMLRNHVSLLLEQYIYGLAQRVQDMNCEVARRWESQHVHTTPKPPVMGWNILSDGRRCKSPHYLWHQTDSPADYAHLAQQVGLHMDKTHFAGLCSQQGK